MNRTGHVKFSAWLHAGDRDKKLSIWAFNENAFSQGVQSISGNKHDDDMEDSQNGKSLIPG